MSIIKPNNNTISAITALPAAIPTGKVLQVVTATDSTNRSTTSTSFVTASNTLSVDITPSSTSSKILIHLSCMLYVASSFARLTIFRDNTDLSGSSGAFATTDGDSAYYATSGMHFLDSPNSSSQITYQMRFKTNSTQVEIANVSALGTITAYEIAG